MEASDRQLLSRYTAGGDETAFRVLVERHLGLVHGVALRVTRNEHLAKDIAQQTFIRLASRAAMIPTDLPLPAWLHRVCRHLAIDLVRAEERRKQRELASPHPMSNDPEPTWSSLAPVVDQLVNDLPAAERSVLVLRFYCDQPHAAIASQLGVTEAVARKRASRALERLRGMLAKRGIATTATALATLLPVHAAAPVPPSLAASVLKASQGIAPLAPTPLHAAALAMNATQKSTIAAAALIFLVSAGYSVVATRGLATGTAPSNSTSPSLATTASTRPERSRTERKMPAGTAGRLEWLKQILEIESQAKRQRELLAFIDALRPDQFREAAEFLGARNKEQYTSVEEYHLFLAAWTKVDTRAALEYAEASNNFYHLGRVLMSWADLDPAAAIAWAEKHRSNVPLGYVLSGIAATDPGKALEVVEAMPDKEQRAQALLNIWASMREQADAINRLLPQVSDPALEDRLVERIATVSSQDRPDQVVRLLLRHPAVGSPRKIAEVFESWASESPGSAITALGNLPSGEIRKQSVMTVCEKTLLKDPAKAFEVLEKYPETATEESMAKLAPMAVILDPAGMLDRIQGIRDTTLRDEALFTALRRYQESSKEAAQDWMRRNPVPDQVRQRLAQIPAKPE
ncbi:sigma-70 family RNA polymerase sigma factor [Haloferula sp. BvORR071]|uniref:RNA polymerase sigma factor n=1 Tax=Haloferula sp. BvORR071 TaxID=1396141 RepID=UPI00054ED128|nr:sigma-70 family RNA polymerase sigma factor [Haloferula sp. BvORR071]